MTGLNLKAALTASLLLLTTHAAGAARAPADTAYLFNYAPGDGVECCVIKPTFTNAKRGILDFKDATLTISPDTDGKYRFELDVAGSDRRWGSVTLPGKLRSRVKGQLWFKFVVHCRLDTDEHCPWPGEMSFTAALPLSCDDKPPKNHRLNIPAGKTKLLRKMIQGTEGNVKLFGFVSGLVAHGKNPRPCYAKL